MIKQMALIQHKQRKDKISMEIYILSRLPCSLCYNRHQATLFFILRKAQFHYNYSLFQWHKCTSTIPDNVHTRRLIFSLWGPLKFVPIFKTRANEKFHPWIRVYKRNQLHRIILVLYSTTLNFNDILIINLFQIQFNGE